MSMRRYNPMVPAALIFTGLVAACGGEKDQQKNVVLAQAPRLLHRPLRHGFVEVTCLLHGGSLVQPQTIDLDDARIRRPAEEGKGWMDCALEQPRRRRGPNQDAKVGCASSLKRVDDFDFPGRMAEAMARNIEADGWHPISLRGASAVNYQLPTSKLQTPNSKLQIFSFEV